MQTLRRYLWREIATATLFVLLALLGIFALFDLINQLRDLGRANYQIGHVLAFVALLTPAHAYELMPIAALIGTIYALSKLAANSEFTIMRVSGMTTRRLADAVLWVGLGLVALAYVFGELIAPPAEDLAQRFRSRAIGVAIGQEFRSGVWVRDLVHGRDGQPDRLRFVNVAQVNADGTVNSWRIFEFDPELHLRSMSTAASGTYESGRGWLLADVVDTQLPPVEAQANPASPVAQLPQEGTRVVHEPLRLWQSDLTPAIFGVLLVQPERQSAYSLYHYIGHLTQNHQRTDRYEIALWKKLFYPLVCVVMMALALPFAYLHVRAGTVSLKIFAGIMIGVLFYAINKLFSHLGMINTWPPVVVAGLPALVALACALAALYWVERR
ncbi:MAG TPA: LPS export ABC transporter permease LptG [Burkholderiaceae bacterium]|nr:LPS export ABC transporter permease LptG [Burkholderiaceae bacterium]